MAYGSEKRTWLEEQLKLLAATGPRTSGGRPIRVEAKAMGSGEAQQAVLSGSFRPTPPSTARPRVRTSRSSTRPRLPRTLWRSRCQEQALRLGFRPADPAVPLRNQDPSNPFNRLAPYGLQLDLPQAAPAPDGAIVRNLLSMWSRIVPRSP